MIVEIQDDGEIYIGDIFGVASITDIHDPGFEEKFKESLREEITKAGLRKHLHARV